VECSSIPPLLGNFFLASYETKYDSGERLDETTALSQRSEWLRW